MVRSKYRAMGSRCEPGRYFSVEITAHFHYEVPSHKPSAWVILIPQTRETDYTQTFLIALGTRRDANSVGLVPHPVRDDGWSTRHDALSALSRAANDEVLRKFLLSFLFINEEENIPILQTELARRAQRTRLRNYFCR